MAENFRDVLRGEQATPLLWPADRRWLRSWACELTLQLTPESICSLHLRLRTAVEGTPGKGKNEEIGTHSCPTPLKSRTGVFPVSIFHGPRDWQYWLW